MVYTGTVSGFGLILTGLYKLSNLRRSHEFKDKKNILRTDKLYAGTYAFRYLTFGALTILTTAFGSLFFNN